MSSAQTAEFESTTIGADELAQHEAEMERRRASRAGGPIAVAPVAPAAPKPGGEGLGIERRGQHVVIAPKAEQPLPEERQSPYFGRTAAAKEEGPNPFGWVLISQAENRAVVERVQAKELSGGCLVRTSTRLCGRGGKWDIAEALAWLPDVTLADLRMDATTKSGKRDGKGGVAGMTELVSTHQPAKTTGKPSKR